MTALLLLLSGTGLWLLFRYTRPGGNRRLIGRQPAQEAQWDVRDLLLTRVDWGALERAVTDRRRQHLKDRQ